MRFYAKPIVKLVHITPNVNKLIEWAGRQSTGTSKDINDLGFEEECRSYHFVKRRVKDKHFSLGRFGIVMFEIQCSRNCSHQLMRHKHIDWCQLSQRYTKQKPEFMVPPEIGGALALFYRFKDSCMQSYNDYLKLVENGVKKQDARFVLPSASITSLAMVMNFQAARDFLLLRGEKSAQWEIRHIAKEIGISLINKANSFFEDLEEFVKKIEGIEVYDYSETTR